MKDSIYMDYAATSPVLPEVLEEMLPFFTEKYGNPSGVYATGREARRAVEKARRQIADAIGAQPQEICFTSGGSESDNLAIQGTAFALKEKGNHLVTSRIEHHAVLNACRQMERSGFRVSYACADGEGRVSPENVESLLEEGTILVSVMAANNEIGTIEPTAEIGRIAREHGVLFHTDAVQAAGVIPLNVDKMNADLMSLSAHKFHGPKGTGALYVRKGTRISGMILGGAQERNLRAGTENVPGIVGMGKAMEIAVREMNTNAERICILRDMLIRGIRERIPDAVLNGPETERLPGNCHFSFRGVDGEALLLRLDLAGIAASGGSACTSGSPEVSHVLEAIGLPEEQSRGSIRLTIGRETTEEEIREVLRILPDIVTDLRLNDHFQ